MQSFISQTLDDIFRSQSTFENSVFVVPSQRASVFVRNEFKKKLTQGFLPEIITIEQLTESIAQIQRVDSIQLLFHFYEIYKNHESQADSFDSFCSWAFVALQDFNEVDQYLVNAQDLFIYLRDIQRLRKWSVKGEFKETDLIKDNLAFMEKLGLFYQDLYQSLTSKKIGYQGLVYREASKKVDGYLKKHSNKRFFFLGFNALNKAEEHILQAFLSEGNTSIYWDIDRTFLNSQHAAGSFIRRYAEQWKYYQDQPLKLVHDSFSSLKNIKVIGTAKNVAQLKYAGELLNQLNSFDKTALVLGDESLLSVALNSIPKKVDSINITMGYPLQNIPTSNFIVAFFQLWMNQEKLQKTDSGEFYFKDVLKVFKNPMMFQLLKDDETDFIFQVQKSISEENRAFISFDGLKSFTKNLEKEHSEILLSLFEPLKNVSDFIQRLLQFIEQIRSQVSELEKEYLFRFHTAFTQLQNLHESYGYFNDIKILYHFYKRVLATEKLSFQGEPLQGLQLMGMLETRMLDFENVIITSVNEGILPSNNTQNSFIPFDVKVQFGLPTYREKDAIFSYHFFRLLQRTKNIYLLYNTENDSYGNGEKSRFITQLELMRDDIQQTTIHQRVETENSSALRITKNPEILSALKEYAEKGFSPSAITRYLYNPIEFYKERILGIKETEEVEETVAANTLGTIVHDSLDELYAAYKGQFLTPSAFESMQKKVNALVKKYFAKHFKSGDYRTGKNRLIFEVAKKYIQRFLTLEKELILAGNQIKILATEQKLSTNISISGIEFPIKIKGIVDRIDEFNGLLRIVDYKTGFVEAKQLKVGELQQIADIKFDKAIQVLLYTLLYTHNSQGDHPEKLQAGIYSFRNLKSGFLPINFSTQYRGQDLEISKDRLESAMTTIAKVLQEIFNLDIAFEEPQELPY